MDAMLTKRFNVVAPLGGAAVLACLCMLSCAHETPERPLPAAPAQEAPLPFPDTAFTSTEAPPSPARFETRRVGAEPAAPGSRFRGAPIDLDLKGADLADVFRLIADVGHVNIVVAGEVTGTITLRLKHVPWDQALDVVARAKDLDVEREGNVIIVATRKH